MLKLPLGTVVVLLLLSSSRAQHEGEGESVEAASTTTFPPCARPLEELRASIEDIFPENYTVYLNCISFDGEGALRTAIASGELTGQPDLKFLVECRSQVLIALPLTITVPSIDRTNVERGCLECNDTATGPTCVGECDPKCERCYDTASTCTRCTACISRLAEECIYESGHSLECRTMCPVSELNPSIIAFTINHEEYNYCDCAAPSVRNLNTYPTYEPGREIPEIECEEGEEEPPPSSCDAQCMIGGHDRNNETGTCFACGIAYCERCERGVNGAPDRCTDCIIGTILYVEHGITECVACPNAPIAQVALEQEEEEEIEEAQQRARTEALAISLPLVSVAIIVFFVGMSVFAHHRYPHVSYHGRKRHRRPPTGRSTSPEGDIIPDELAESHVWRPRPTIVLR